MASQAQTPATPYDLIGGHPTLQRVVERFYDLMEQDPAYAELRALHAPELAPMRHSLTGFLAAWSGGPRDWHTENPGKCMMSAHKGIAISAAVAEQWADAMTRAIADADLPHADLSAEMTELLARMARSMARN
ncbi:globin-like protein [Caenibius tardaugens NBRC 16725]|uniref:Globin-like protein n=1 Tax=Caenibius tardaugens NBRC 16725 TaxID=1219035 RepID=U2YKW0_9SPHN|nr:globin-like protein [Caenibius tardaugens]AZI35982.1 globin [Caenibius tardaugens NBRC 16725]GAD48957.1 globin-like protein [Caenibius tardaugens NBRC 16725]